jgi:hypothetical protein
MVGGSFAAAESGDNQHVELASSRIRYQRKEREVSDVSRKEQGYRASHL